MPDQYSFYSTEPNENLQRIGASGGLTGILMKELAPYNIINGDPIPPMFLDEERQVPNPEFSSFILDNYVMGTFGGIGAKTANKALLKKAKQMAKEGAEPQVIFNETGWFKPVSGKKWRNLIDDSELKFKDAALRNQKSNQPYQGTLETFIEHPQLFEAYPELRQLYFSETAYDSPLVYGGYEPTERGFLGQRVKDPMLRLNAAAYKDPDSFIYKPREEVLGHELQHSIQEIEGFSRGGSPSEVGSGAYINDFPDPAQVNRIENDLFDATVEELGMLNHPSFGRPSLKEYAHQRGYKRPTPKLEREYREVFKIDEGRELWSSINKRVGFKLYQKLLGEKEAEAAAKQIKTGAYGLPDFALEKDLIRRNQ